MDVGCVRPKDVVEFPEMAWLHLLGYMVNRDLVLDITLRV